MKTRWLAAILTGGFVILGAWSAQAQTVYVPPVEVDWFHRHAYRGPYNYHHYYPYGVVYSTRTQSYNRYVEDPRDQYQPYIHTRISPGGRVYQTPGYTAEVPQRFSVGGRPIPTETVKEK
jgi:hypothetical protein